MRFLAAFGLALVLALTGCAAQEGPTPRLGLTAQQMTTTDLTAAAQAVSPTVVGLALSNQGQLTGIGSGLFVDASGLVLTNAHVAQGGSEITLVLQDGEKIAADLIWEDPALDMALCRAREGGPYPAATLGTSQNLRAGQPVLAIGTPLTLQFQHTVTQGVVSAVERSLPLPADGNGASFLEGLIQTDASINPGNSGGPLVNESGEVIGLVTVKVEDAAGLGFAIPIDVAKVVIQRCVADGGYETPTLGLYAFDVAIARYMGQEAALSEGLYIMGAVEGSPAQKAGLRQGDILLYMDGQPLTSMLELRRLLYAHRPGDAIALEYIRDGARAQQSLLVGRSEG